MTVFADRAGAEGITVASKGSEEVAIMAAEGGGGGVTKTRSCGAIQGRELMTVSPVPGA